MKLQLSICLFFVNFALVAQDRIIMASADTLNAKVTAIDKEKIVYYLDADNTKTVKVIPLSDVCKVIWRNNLEYIINAELNKSLLAKVKKTEKKAVQSQVFLPIKNKMPNVPEISYKKRRWRIYYINGKKSNFRDVYELVSKYDSFLASELIRGRKMLRLGSLIQLIASISTYMPWSVTKSKTYYGGYVTSEKFNEIYYLSVAVWVSGIIEQAIGRGTMLDAIDGFNSKRKIGTLKLQNPTSPAPKSHF